MKQTIIVMILFLAVLISAGCGSRDVANQALTCRIEVNKNEAALGDFVTATVILENTGSHTLRVLSLKPDPKRQDAGLFIQTTGPDFSVRFPEPDTPRVKPYAQNEQHFVELTPGRTFQQRIPVGWSYMVAAGISAKPGEYTLVGKYIMPEAVSNVWSGTVVSQPVAVRIKEKEKQ